MKIHQRSLTVLSGIILQFCSSDAQIKLGDADIRSAEGITISSTKNNDANELVGAAISLEVDFPERYQQYELVWAPATISYKYSWSFSNGVVDILANRNRGPSSSITGAFTVPGTQTISVTAIVTGTAHYRSYWKDGRGSDTYKASVVGCRTFRANVTVLPTPGISIVADKAATIPGGTIHLRSVKNTNGKISACKTDWTVVPNFINAAIKSQSSAVSGVSISADAPGTVTVKATDPRDPHLTKTIAVSFAELSLLTSDHNMLYAGAITHDVGGHQTQLRARIRPPVPGFRLDFRINPSTPKHGEPALLASDCCTVGKTRISLLTDLDGNATAYFTTSDKRGTATIDAKAADSKTWTHFTKIAQVVPDTATIELISD